MDYNNHNTTLRTNKHLNFEERFYLEKRILLGDSITAISRALGRSRTTIYTELKRGTVIQIRQGKSQLVYLADSGQATYERQRVGSFNTMRVGAIEAFINWIESKVLNDHWSFDAAVGYAKVSFNRRPYQEFCCASDNFCSYVRVLNFIRPRKNSICRDTI